MKKLFLITLLAFTAFQAKAQFEIKLSPIPLLFGSVAFSVEGAVSESFGLDGDLLLLTDDFSDPVLGANFSGKYYFNPSKGIDRFHVGVFIGGIIQESVPGLGFLLGYKWVSKKNVIFELGGGIGRSLDGDSVLGYGKLHLGYRFNGKNKTKSQR